MITLIEKFPFLIYLLLGVTGLAVIVAIIVIFQGREVSTPLIKFGERRGDTPQKVTNQQSSELSSQEMEEVISRVAERAKELREVVQNRLPKFIYQPKELTDQHLFLYSARHEMQTKVQQIVLGWGGPWAGVTLATFPTFLDLAKTHQLIPPDLIQEIEDFYQFTDPFLVHELISEYEFLDVKYLAANLKSRLDRVYVGPNY